jgi:hypothetical protein
MVMEAPTKRAIGVRTDPKMKMRLRVAIATISVDFPYYDTFREQKTTRSVASPLRERPDRFKMWCSAESTNVLSRCQVTS